MVPVTYEPRALWQKFRVAFTDALSSVKSELIKEAWTKELNPRTRLYKEKILPAVRDSLELDYCPEELRVDHVLCERKSRVPLVFIESENNAFSASKEVWKLCSVSAPLRVLITVVEWDDTPDVWQGGSRREELLGKWGSIALDQQRVWPNRGLLVVIVGERWHDSSHDRLRFYAHSFSPQTEKWQDEGLLDGGILLERNLIVG